jgi:hypothetical protein
MQSWLEKHGILTRCVWLRFPRLFCVPFLIYARLRGYSHREAVEGHQHGYWEFSGSWLMSRVFPWALLLDTLLSALVKVYVPLWRGCTVICDRFVVDILADLMTGLNDDCFDERLPGRLFWALLPRNARVFVLDLDTETTILRCPELKGDRTHTIRRANYLKIAHCYRLSTVPADAPIESVFLRLVQTAFTTDPSAIGSEALFDLPLDRG